MQLTLTLHHCSKNGPEHHECRRLPLKTSFESVQCGTAWQVLMANSLEAERTCKNNSNPSNSLTDMFYKRNTKGCSKIVTLTVNCINQNLFYFWYPIIGSCFETSWLNTFTLHKIEGFFFPSFDTYNLPNCTKRRTNQAPLA